MTKFYTITGKTDGFGAQYQALMSGIAYCLHTKSVYVHRPMSFIEHNGDVALLNKFIGIPSDSKITTIQKDKIIKKPFIREVHYSKYPSKYYNPTTIQILRNYYYSTPKPIDNVEIAIHIRRGDVSQKNASRYTSNNEYKKIIDFLVKKYPQYNITIFSQGNIEDFEDLQNIDKKPISFRLNESIEKTFNAFVSAKVLVCAKSSFSYSAAILNPNVVYYLNFWHKPLNHWKTISLSKHCIFDT